MTKYDTVKSVDFLRPSHDNIQPSAADWRYEMYVKQADLQAMSSPGMISFAVFDSGFLGANNG